LSAVINFDGSATPAPTPDSGVTLDEITVEAARPDAAQTTGDAQFGRQLQLIVTNAQGQGLDLSQFRVVFRVSRGDLQNPNTADIRVYNLNTDTANSLAGNNSQYTQLALQVGYQGQNLGLIFAGTIAQARIGRVNQLDSYVDFTAGDGDEPYNFATLTAPLSAGSSGPAAVLANFLRSMQAAASANGSKLTQGYAGPLGTNAPPRGKVLYGNTKDLLRTFARTNDMVWSIQNGQLTLIPRSSYVPGNTIILSPATGLIGSPEQIQNGVSARMLLNPQVGIGSAVKIVDATINQFRYTPGLVSQASNWAIQQSNAINGQGLYYVMNVEHFGDTRGNDWYTDMVCLSIDASVAVVNTSHIDGYFINPGPIPRN
jgi:hypothetical protein